MPDRRALPRPPFDKKSGIIVTTPILRSNRLTLRGFALADAPRVQTLAGQIEIADTTLAIPHPYEDGLAEAWITGHEAAFSDGRAVAFAITRARDASLVGAISLVSIEAGHQAELGYWIGVPYWNRGYCTEAAQMVLDYAFGELGLIRVYARHLARNPASGRVLTKLGFLHEGTRRKHVKKWNAFEDVEDYGIVREGDR